LRPSLLEPGAGVEGHNGKKEQPEKVGPVFADEIDDVFHAPAFYTGHGREV